MIEKLVAGVSRRAGKVTGSADSRGRIAELQAVAKRVVEALGIGQTLNATVAAFIASLAARIGPVLTT